jgi:hypothetical protein
LSVSNCAILHDAAAIYQDFYQDYSGNHDPKVCYKATYQVPDNKACWSITVYGNDGYMRAENSIVDSSPAIPLRFPPLTAWTGVFDRSIPATDSVASTQDYSRALPSLVQEGFDEEATCRRNPGRGFNVRV